MTGLVSARFFPALYLPRIDQTPERERWPCRGEFRRVFIADLSRGFIEQF